MYCASRDASSAAREGGQPGRAADPLRRRVRRRARAHLDGRAVQADELVVHRRVERAPVVPALGHGGAGGGAVGTGRAADRRQVGVRAPLVHRPLGAHIYSRERDLVGERPRLVPLQPEVVVDPRVVRFRRRLDQRRRGVPVLVEHVRKQPLLHYGDRCLDLGLRLRQEVAVEVEAVAVGPRARGPSVRVLVGVEDDDRVVEDAIDLRIGPVRGRREPVDQEHHRVDALVLVSVDCALDEDRDLEVALLPESRLGLGRVGERVPPDLLPVLEVLLLVVRGQLVDRDEVHRAASGGMTEDLHRHPPVEALCLDGIQRAPDRVVRDVRKAAGRVGRIASVRQRARRVGLGRSAPGRCDRDRPGGSGPRKREREHAEAEQDDPAESGGQELHLLGREPTGGGSDGWPVVGGMPARPSGRCSPLARRWRIHRAPACEGQTEVAATSGSDASRRAPRRPRAPMRRESRFPRRARGCCRRKTRRRRAARPSAGPP